MQFIIDPPAAHGPKQRLIMQTFLQPGVEEIWLACGTKWGKTISASAAIVNGVFSKPRSIFRWVAPYYSQSKIGWSYVKTILPPPPHVRLNHAGLQASVPSNGSAIQFYHAQNPVSLEGYGIAGYVFDEAAKMKEDVYSSAKTTVTVTRGPMLFISTPLGKNWFHKKCMEAADEMDRAKHEGRTPKKLFITAPTADNPHVPREAIESARRNLSARLFRQYYLAAFEDTGDVFPEYRQCVWTDELDLYGDSQKWLASGAREMSVVVGADWAKTVDYCVFTAIDLESRKVVGVQRFHRQAYTESIRSLVLFTRNFKSCEVVYHDKTGVGMAIDDQLAYTDLNYKGITFTNASKSEMVNRLVTAFEQQAVFIPNWKLLLNELDAFEVQVSSVGLLKYAASSGHDDSVCSLLLAHSALLDYATTLSDIQYLEDLQPQPLSELSRLYQGLDDDDD